MSKKDFDEFLKNKVKAKPDDEPIDWDEQRKEWLEYLDQLYSKIENFLDEYVKDGKVIYKFTDKSIFEEYIGSYTARILNIKLGEHKVKLDPIGTNLIGAKGRVDMIGANGVVRFILVNKKASSPSIKVSIWIDGEKPPEKETEQEIVEWDWKIGTPPPSIKYVNLEQDTFFEALMEVVGG